MPQEPFSHPSSTTTLPPHKRSLLNACASASVLTFGTYTLKSGRESPYFFNAGLLHTATLLETLGNAYAVTILEHSQPTSNMEDEAQRRQIEDFANFDVIFGPAYKGLPLAIQTLSALHRHSPPTYSTRSYAFNRKEAKPHGDGGIIVGAPLRGKRVLIVDDVITAGTALRDAVRIIEAEGGRVVGVVVALDRQERIGGVEEEGGGGVGRSAVGELRREVGVPVVAVLGLDDLIGFVEEGGKGWEGRLREYRERYGARD